MQQAEDSVSRLFVDLKNAKGGAEQQLWNVFFKQLVAEARKRLKGAKRRVEDEEDVASSVFASLCRDAAAGRFDAIDNRLDLWRLLLAMTHRKAIDLRRRENRAKRGGRETRGDSVFVNGTAEQQRRGMDSLVGETLTPEFIAIMGEEIERLTSLLHDDSLRTVMQLRFEGRSTQEIADQMDVCTRTIDRKLRLIRQHWSAETYSQIQ